MTLTVGSGYFYVDENLYYLYGEKIVTTAEDCKYYYIGLDQQIIIPTTVPVNYTGDRVTSDFGVFYDGSPVEDYIYYNDGLYVKGTHAGPYQISGLLPHANTGDDSLLWYDVEIIVTSDRAFYIIPNVSADPVIITDTTLLPTDPYVYQQHRFYIESFNTDYNKVCFNKPYNLFPDPDFSSLYAYSGAYSYITSEIIGCTGISGAFSHTIDNYIYPEFRFDTFYSGDISVNVNISSDVTSEFYTVTTSCDGIGVLRMFFGDCAPRAVQYSTNVCTYEYTDALSEPGVYSITVEVTGDLVHFVQATYDIYANEYNNNRDGEIYIEYATSEGSYDTGIFPSPLEMVHNRGFFVIDTVYNDANGVHYTDFDCPDRSLYPFAKCTGINKYHNLYISEKDWMTYPELEYRYDHDVPVLDVPVFGYIGTDVGMTSDICIIQRNTLRNPEQFVEIGWYLNSDYLSFGSIITSDPYTNSSGLAFAQLSFTPYSSSYVPTPTGESQYYMEYNYDCYGNVFIYDSSSYIYIQGSVVEYSTGLPWTSEQLSAVYVLSPSEEKNHVITVSEDNPVIPINLYASSSIYTSDASTYLFTGSDYAALSYVNNKVPEAGEFTVEGGKIIVNTSYPYLYFYYTERQAWSFDNKIYINDKLNTFVSTYFSNPSIAVDFVDILAVGNEDSKYVTDSIYYRNSEYYRSLFTGTL